MATIDYKEKYEQALAKAKEQAIDGYLDAVAVKDIFPELAESEDEKIRKAIIATIHLYYGERLEDEAKEMIAWLEKQGEQKPNPYSGTSFKYNGHTWGMCARDNGVEILIDGHIKSRVFIDDSNAKEMFIKALERVEEQNAKGYKLTDCDKNSWWEDFKAYTTSKQILANSAKTCKDEQKPAVVIPKFKVGDWITNGIDTKKIIGIELKNEDYLFENGISDISLADNISHLWTIQDAKDGDVLAFDSDTIVIFKDLYNATTFHSYCHIEDGVFTASEEGVPDWWEGEGFYPATKEQHDLLFQKMKEAGYEWDAEKKELKKIKQKPAWSEEDMLYLEQTLQYLKVAAMRNTDPKKVDKCKDWLKSLKDRVLPQPKQEWSEEDESHIRYLIECLEHCKKGVALTMTTSTSQEYINWLKSLKDKYTWKPTEEQMEAVRLAAEIGTANNSWAMGILKGMYQDLKKLKS